MNLPMMHTRVSPCMCCRNNLAPKLRSMGPNEFRHHNIKESTT